MAFPLIQGKVRKSKEGRQSGGSERGAAEQRLPRPESSHVPRAPESAGSEAGAVEQPLPPPGSSDIPLGNSPDAASPRSIVRDKTIRVPRPVGRVLFADIEVARRLHRVLILNASLVPAPLTSSPQDYAALFEMKPPALLRQIHSARPQQQSQVRYELEWTNSPTGPLEDDWVVWMLLRRMVATSVAHAAQRVKSRRTDQLIPGDPLALFGSLRTSDSRLQLAAQRAKAKVELTNIDTQIPDLGHGSRSMFALGIVGSIQPFTLETAVLAL